MPLVIRDGDWTLTVTDELESDLRAAVKRAGAGPVLQRIEEETKRLGNQARNLMPVRTGKTRDSVRWWVEVTLQGAIRGRVTAASHMRYVRSWQLSSESPRPNEGERARLRKAGVPNPMGRWMQIQRLHRDLRIGKRKAARTGAARWVLFGWPEKAASEVLVRELGPLIERSLDEVLDGR